MENTMQQIVVQANQTRSHLVAALHGLDEIIRLAEEAGRDDVAKAAKAARVPVTRAAKTFNRNVASSDNPTKIDPVVLDEANKTADKAEKTTEELLKELQRRVDGIESNVTTWGFSSDRFGDGKPKPTEGSWADWTTKSISSHGETLNGHENRIKALEEKGCDPSPNWRFGALVGALVGAIFYVISGVMFGWSAMIIPALAVTGLVTLGVAILVPREEGGSSSGASDTQPRG